MRVLFIFLDGVGLGEATPDNPFLFSDTPFLKDLMGGKPLTWQAIGLHNDKVSLPALDTGLGVPGIPQSATGQASIFTGVNAPRLLGRHLNGFPNEPLRNLLARCGIFRKLLAEGYSCAFANAYRPDFFRFFKQGLPGDRFSCTTLITYYAGLPFYTLDDLRNGRALYMDITNKSLREMGLNVPEISPVEGGRRLAEISKDFDFTLFEFFLSDVAGHLGLRETARALVTCLDTFLGAIVKALDAEDTLLLVSSDHGNLEDLSGRSHTGNPVPALLVGRADLRETLVSMLRDLTDLAPAIEQALLWNGKMSK